VWALQSRYFAHHGFNALAVRLARHGRSQGPALPSVEAIATGSCARSTRRVGTATLLVIRSARSRAWGCRGSSPARVRKLALLGPAVPMAVSDVLLDAAKADDHVAYELINGWSHSAPRQIGRQSRARHVDDRCRAAPHGAFGAGVCCTGPLRVQRPTPAGSARRANVRCPTPDPSRQRGPHGAPAKNAEALSEALADVRVVTLQAPATR
jgi:hypothetical protein